MSDDALAKENEWLREQSIGNGNKISSLHECLDKAHKENRELQLIAHGYETIAMENSELKIELNALSEMMEGLKAALEKEKIKIFRCGECGNEPIKGSNLTYLDRIDELKAEVERLLTIENAENRRLRNERDEARAKAIGLHGSNALLGKQLTEAREKSAALIEALKKSVDGIAHNTDCICTICEIREALAKYGEK